MNASEESKASAVRVFISYSHDNPGHCDQVLALAQQLRRDGIDAWVDQFEQSPGQGWPLWCARQILDAKYVLLICTELYRKRFLGLEEFGKGRGVKWEGKVIQNILYYKEIYEEFDRLCRSAYSEVLRSWDCVIVPWEQIIAARSETWIPDDQCILPIPQCSLCRTSAYGTPVKFTFPNTNERRFPGVAH